MQTAAQRVAPHARLQTDRFASGWLRTVTSSTCADAVAAMSWPSRKSLRFQTPAERYTSGGSRRRTAQIVCPHRIGTRRDAPCGYRTVTCTPPCAGCCTSIVSVTTSMLRTMRSTRCAVTSLSGTVSSRTAPTSVTWPSTVRSRFSESRRIDGAGLSVGVSIPDADSLRTANQARRR